MDVLGILLITESLSFPFSSPGSHGSYSFLILSLDFVFTYINCSFFPQHLLHPCFLLMSVFYGAALNDQ